MRTFIVHGSTAYSDGKFNINDMPGSGGRIDVLARCVTASFVLSDAIRRDVRLYLVVAGQGDSKVIRFDGSELRNLNPDERSTGALLRHTLLKRAGEGWTQTGPGVSVRLGGIIDAVKDAGAERLVLLVKDGEPTVELPEDPVIVLGDHRGFPEDVELALREFNPRTASIGPEMYHSDHCIVHVNISLDSKSCSHGA